VNLRTKIFNRLAAPYATFLGWPLLLAGLMSLFLLAGCLEATKEEVKEPKFYKDLKPMDPQPAASAIRPGLKVWYFDDFQFTHIDQMPKGDPPFSFGFAGKPVPILDKKYKIKENFLDSGMHRLFGAQFDGMIKFPKPGEYVLVATANDGIRIWVGKKVVINDPFWHATGDEYTPEAHITISARKANIAISSPGWYRFRIKYFQKKGTATLQMFWKKPGDTEFSFIPAEAYAHMADTTG
jgi:hypothetical protein